MLIDYPRDTVVFAHGSAQIQDPIFLEWLEIFNKNSQQYHD